MKIVYDFDMVKPLPPRVTTEGYKVLDKELQQVLCEQNKLRLEEMQRHTCDRIV